MFNTYRAKITEVVDGDSLKATVKLGMGTVKVKQDLRLLGVDTHEIHFVSHDSDEYKKGLEEKEFVEDWIDEIDGGEYPLVVRIPGDDTGKYGRWLAIVLPDQNSKWEDSLNQTILDNFDGVEYS